METQSYKVRLGEMLETITLDLKAVGIHNPQNASDWVAVPGELDTEEPDVNLAADAVEEWNERTALVATLEREYNNIVSALARIESNTFGNCEVCGEAIEENRLNANPTARTCIAHLEENSHI
ncbi:MAG: TraR/DksA C4-type zinc finger protein [Minisyncoccia bacterium]